MTDDSTVSLGIDLSGITDATAICCDSPFPRLTRHPVTRPACVIAPGIPGERPLGGDAAYQSLDGRGWDPAHRRSRHSVLQLLQSLECKADGPDFMTGSEIGNLVAAHIGAQGDATSEPRIITVPDTLSELGQQRLLDGLRRSNIASELLWRPVATLLGWACRQPAKTIALLDKTSVLVMHAGFWTPEVNLFELEVEGHQDRQLLMPIRHGRGLGLRDSVAWSVERTALDILRADVAQVGLATTLATKELLWISRRPWSLLCGEPAPEEVILDPSSRWHRLKKSTTPLRSATELVKALKELLGAASATASGIGLVLVEGPLVGLVSDGGTVGDLLKVDAMRRDGLRARNVEILPASLGLNAGGAAHYGWRRRLGIPGYYDTIPDLKINACIDKPHGPAFISLMQGQDRVVGGQPVGPQQVPGFSIAARTEAVNYFLSRADEPTVRETRTQLPQPPTEDTPVTLVVTQTPGQGFASVEIRPSRNRQLGYSPVFLDWNSMRDTGKTPEELLSDLKKECGFSYPDVTPFPCHAAVWQAYRVVAIMLNFLGAVRHDAAGAGNEAKKLMSTLGKKGSLDWLLNQQQGNRNKAGIFDSDGKTPPEHDLRSRLGPPPIGYGTYQELVDEIRERIGLQFEARMNTKHKGNGLHRHLFLAGGWCYASAPSQILAYTRKAIHKGESLFKKYDFNVAGRCFFSNGDIALLFERVDEDFRFLAQARNSPFDRIKALSLVLSYRADAAKVLDKHRAQRLAKFAAELMREEQQQCNIAQKFFKAAHLLMGLLRFRLVDPKFLDVSQPEDAVLVRMVKQTLQDAQQCNLGNGTAKVKMVLEQMTAFIEKRGTNALIFSELESLSD